MAPKNSRAAKRAAAVSHTMKVQDFLANFPKFIPLNLSMHESKNAPALPGGHTLFKHVGATVAVLQNVWNIKPSSKKASSFYDSDTAHAAITQAIASRFDTVLDWALDPEQEMCTIKHQLSYNCGIIILRDDLNKVIDTCQLSVTFLRCKSGVFPLHHGILSAYPILEDL